MQRGWKQSARIGAQRSEIGGGEQKKKEEEEMFRERKSPRALRVAHARHIGI